VNVTFKVYRFDPDTEGKGRMVDYQVPVETGDVVLSALHKIHDYQDGGLAYRYSCRGAICGSCAMKINGTAALACKTQILPLVEGKDPAIVTVAPLTNHAVLKDLVVRQDPFWEAVARFMPWLHRETETDDPVLDYAATLDKTHWDQMNRSGDCIRCGACYSDCPKVTEDPRFIGPAASVALYRFLYDPRNRCDAHEEMATDASGPRACDSHAICVKVCPKDVRPLRAINLIRRDHPVE
jgi:succinate dehydrogenase / fumarate reductase, iron-sulfur subunit